MLKVGLTGNIGSGKTLVAKVFETLGVPVFQADISGRERLASPDVIQTLRTRFGDQVIQADGLPDRKAIASLVFSDSHALEWLNNLIHPLVWQSYQDWQLMQQSSYTIHEAAILFEHGFDQYFNYMILVAAPVELRMQRVMQRDGIDEITFRHRASKQWQEEKLRAMAHAVIENDGIQALLPQVLALHEKLSSRG